MEVRRRSLGPWSLVIGILVSGCATTYNSQTLKLRENENNPYSIAVSQSQWSRVERLSEESSDPFIQLVHLRSLYELKKYAKVIAFPQLPDERFEPYAQFLKTLSLFESEQWDRVKDFPQSTQLPSPLQQRLLVMQGEAAQQMMDLPRAQKLYESFLQTYPKSSLRADMLARLADLSFSSGDEERAIEIYEELYKSFPFSQADASAKSRLIESGRFDTIDMDAHLDRVSAFRRSARFSRAHREIDDLIKGASGPSRMKLLLSKAQIYFADKAYASAEKLARKNLQSEMPEDLEMEWRQLHAASLVRLDRPKEGMAIYRQLLTRKLPKALRESILYRLGLTALNENEFHEAAQSFLDIQDLKFDGSYNESSRWYGAWALLMAHRPSNRQPQTLNEAKEGETETLPKAIQLLKEIEGLNTTPLLKAQSLYWRSVAEKRLHNDDEAIKNIDQLRKDFPLSIYGLLPNPKIFLRITRQIPAALRDASPPRFDDEHDDLSSIARHTSWIRLELFRAVRFNSWAQMELDEFLATTKKTNSTIKRAVAERLYDLGDWASLVIWADRHLKLKKIDLSDSQLAFHYPKAFEFEVLKASKEFKISPFLIWGIMREESRYRADVISGAGAVGLMQVMPFRAKKIARDIGPSAFNLSEPRDNIRFGTYHLKEIQKQIESFPVAGELKPILQIASYNAGVAAAKRWIQERPTDEVDTFMESIPYAETRHYVKRVLQSAYIYSQLYGADASVKSISSELSWRPTRHL